MFSLSPHIAVYTGVFDPVHLGHLDIIERGSRLWERLIVGVGVNPDKSPFFSLEERVELLKAVTKPFKNVEVIPFTGLAVRFVRDLGASIMIRGLRTLSRLYNDRFVLGLGLQHRLSHFLHDQGDAIGAFNDVLSNTLWQRVVTCYAVDHSCNFTLAEAIEGESGDVGSTNPRRLEFRSIGDDQQ